MLVDGVSEKEIKRRLQARVPDFPMSTDPGGQWDWLLGVLAIGGVSLLLAGLSWRLRQKRAAHKEASTSENEIDNENEQEWEERLDDELFEMD